MSCYHSHKVKWYTLGDVSIAFQGDYKKGEDEVNAVGLYEIIENLSLEEKDTQRIKINASKSRKIQYGDILFINRAYSPVKNGVSSIYLGKEDAFLLDSCLCFRINKQKEADFYFLKHLLRSKIIRKQIYAKSVGTTIHHLLLSRLSEVKIPLPPLEEQKQTSEALERISDIIETLKEERNMRNKQYKFYLDKVVS